MASVDPTISAKGSNFIGVLNAVERLHGAAARERVLEVLPQDIADPLRYGQVVVVGWYPVEWYAALHAAIDRCLDGGPALARALSREATSADITAMHRAIISVLSVETVFGQAHRLMALYWKGGTIERTALVRGRAQVRFAGWHGFTPLVWEDLMGGMEAILEACGGKNGRCRASSSTLERDTLDIEVRWG